MRVIRLEEQLINEVTEYLKLHGHYKQGMSIAASVRTALSLLIYSTPSLADGRDLAANVLAKAGRAPLSTVRGRVAKFAQTYDWDKAQDIHVPEAVKKEIEQATVKITDEIQVELKECTIKEVPANEPPEEVFPDKPPWELMQTVPIEEILLTHPLHPLVKWSVDSELKIRATECAFGNIPQALHKDQKIIDMAHQLYKYFLRWLSAKGDGK